MTLTDVVITFIVLFGIFAIIYMRITNKSLTDLFNEIKGIVNKGKAK